MSRKKKNRYVAILSCVQLILKDIKKGKIEVKRKYSV